MGHSTRRYSDTSGRPVEQEIVRLRSLGWSDRSIARHLKLPLDDVRAALGISLQVAR